MLIPLLVYLISYSISYINSSRLHVDFTVDVYCKIQNKVKKLPVTKVLYVLTAVYYRVQQTTSEIEKDTRKAANL